MKKVILAFIACSLVVTVSEAQILKEIFGGKKKEKVPVEAKQEEKASLLNDWQKSNNHKFVFLDAFPGTNVSESSSQTEIELGEDFWIRAYFDKSQDKNGKNVTNAKPMDIRITCGGVSMTMKDIWAYSKANFYNSNGILPAYDQLELAGLDQWWKNNNIFAMNSFTTAENFDKPGSPGYACQFNQFPNECVLRMLLAKIDDKVVYGATLEVKYELIQRQEGNYFDEGGDWQTMAEGTVKLKVGDKAKSLTGNLYRLPTGGLQDEAVKKTVKEGMLSKSSGTIAEVCKIEFAASDFNYYKSGSGTPINKWIPARVLFKSTGGIYFTGTVNVVFDYNGTDYSKSVSSLLYQCGVTPVPSFGILSK